LVLLNCVQVEAMPRDEQQREIRRDTGLAAALIAAGALMAGISLAVLIAREPQQMAQATRGTTPGTPPLQGTPAPESTNKPAEAKPGGTRPTTPAPEPAQPDPKAQSEGAKPALPPAPAEKMAPPINPSAKEK
jgi:hypothetical protein